MLGLDILDEQRRREMCQDYGLEERTPGDVVKDAYDNALKNTGRSLWKGVLAVAASGFGKGILVAAVAVVAAAALVFGFGGYAGALEIADATATVEKGVALGVSEGLGMLTTGYGAAAVLAGGAVGAFIDVRKHQNRLSAAEAERMARDYEMLRQQQQNVQMQPMAAPQQAQPNMQALPQDGFCACELKRRAAHEMSLQQVQKG